MTNSKLCRQVTIHGITIQIIYFTPSPSSPNGWFSITIGYDTPYITISDPYNLEQTWWWCTRFAMTLTTLNPYVSKIINCKCKCKEHKS